MRVVDYTSIWIEGFSGTIVHRFEVRGEEGVVPQRSIVRREYEEPLKREDYKPINSKFTLFLQLSPRDIDKISSLPNITIYKVVRYKDGGKETEKHFLADCSLERSTAHRGAKINLHFETPVYIIQKYVIEEDDTKTSLKLLEFRQNLENLFPNNKKQRIEILKKECVKLGGHKFIDSKIFKRKNCKLCLCATEEGE